MTLVSPNNSTNDSSVRKWCLDALIELADEAFYAGRRKDCEAFIEQIYALLDEQASDEAATTATSIAVPGKPGALKAEVSSDKVKLAFIDSVPRHKPARTVLRLVVSNQSST